MATSQVRRHIYSLIRQVQEHKVFLAAQGWDMNLARVFTGTKMQEIVVSRGKILELLRPDANTGKVHTLLTMEVFGIIRSLMAFRLTGGTKGAAPRPLQLPPKVPRRCFKMPVCRLHRHRERQRPHRHPGVQPVQKHV